MLPTSVPPEKSLVLFSSKKEHFLWHRLVARVLSRFSRRDSRQVTNHFCFTDSYLWTCLQTNFSQLTRIISCVRWWRLRKGACSRGKGLTKGCQGNHSLGVYFTFIPSSVSRLSSFRSQLKLLSVIIFPPEEAMLMRGEEACLGVSCEIVYLVFLGTISLRSYS